MGNFLSSYEELDGIVEIKQNPIVKTINHELQHENEIVKNIRVINQYMKDISRYEANIESLEQEQTCLFKNILDDDCNRKVYIDRLRVVMLKIIRLKNDKTLLLRFKTKTEDELFKASRNEAVY